MIHRSSLLLLACGIVACCCSIGEAGHPATQPDVRSAFAALADADAAVRDAARDELMSLNSGKLTQLLSVVRESLPLQPAQASALKEIVTFIYLSGQPYEKTREGFLGIQMPREEDVAVVATRLAGFPGVRYLQDGDIILDLQEAPLAPPVRQRAFSDAVRKFKAGQVIHLKILRHGQEMTVAVTLAPRPSLDPVAEQNEIDRLILQREQAAEQYWKETFAPLIQASAGQK